MRGEKEYIENKHGEAGEDEQQTSEKENFEF